MRCLWTDEQVATLKRYFAEGHSARVIAGLMKCGLTKNSVIGKCNRLGLHRPPAEKREAKASGGIKNSRPVNRPAPPTRATREARAKALKPEPKPMLAKPVLLTGQEKVWTERGPFECNWIVAGEGADSLACCAKVHARGWCAFHYAQGTTKPEKPAPKHRRPIEPTFYDVEAA